MRIKDWLPVAGLAFAAFVFNTSEFIPIGLLSDIAKDFSITEQHAGILITAYAWVVALMSLPLMLMVSGVEYRKLLFWITGVFIASHFMSSVSSTYAMLMLSRMGVACSHAIFWSIAAPLAVKVAPQGRGSSALGMITGGTSIAMILGLPLGRVVGIHLGWRMTFLCIALVTLAVLLLLVIVFPKVRSGNALSLRDVPRIFCNRSLAGIYLMTVVMITAHFTAYSYIEPFLVQVAGFGENMVTATLVVFGVVGIICSVIFSKGYDRKPIFFIRFSVAGISVAMLLLHSASGTVWSMMLVCLGWMTAMTFYNLVFQSEIIRVSPEGTSIAMSAYSGIYNVGIGAGALVGGMVCADIGISFVGYAGGCLAAAAALFCIFILYRKKTIS